MKPRLLSLFCGCVSDAGWKAAGFHVTGIDHKPQPRASCDTFILADALEYVAAHGREYDAIVASPPCQRYSRLTPREYRNRHPDLIAPTRELLVETGRLYVIENVPDAAILLVNPVMLCGTMFALPLERHRYFECSWGLMFSPFACCHAEYPVVISGTTRRKTGRYEYSTAERLDAMGVAGYTRVELDQAYPPAYAEFLGRQLMRYCS